MQLGRHGQPIRRGANVDRACESRLEVEMSIGLHLVVRPVGEVQTVAVWSASTASKDPAATAGTASWRRSTGSSRQPLSRVTPRLRPDRHHGGKKQGREWTAPLHIPENVLPAGSTSALSGGASP